MGAADSSRSRVAVHTDEGTTLASGADALVIGADGFDDDDNRAAGENIVITATTATSCSVAPAT